MCSSSPSSVAATIADGASGKQQQQQVAGDGGQQRQQQQQQQQPVSTALVRQQRPTQRPTQQPASNITATNQNNNCREIHTSSHRSGLPPESEQQQQPILPREQQQQQAASVNLTTPCNQARQQPISHQSWPAIFELRAQLQEQRRSRGVTVNITTSERHRIEVEQHRIESVRRFRYDDY